MPSATTPWSAANTNIDGLVSVMSRVFWIRPICLASASSTPRLPSGLVLLLIARSSWAASASLYIGEMDMGQQHMNQRISHSTLARPACPCYDSVPHETQYANAALSEKRREKVELDEIFETLHNLASSLMNKTLLQLQHRMIFKNLQSISVGI